MVPRGTSGRRSSPTASVRWHYDGVTDRTVRRRAWGLFVVYVLVLLTNVVFDAATRSTPGHAASAFADVLFDLATASFAVVGIVILARQPRNRIGWILLAIGLTWVVGPEAYGEFALSRGLPGGALALSLSAPTWAPPIGLLGTVLLLRFPNGKLLSPRWRIVEWIAIFAIVTVFVTILFGDRSLNEFGYPNLINPLWIPALEEVFGFLQPIILLIPLAVLTSAVSVVLRFRRSAGIERLQMKWLTAAAATVAGMSLIANVASIGSGWSEPTTPLWVSVIQVVTIASFILIPGSIGAAVLRHRLYDIDLIINRAVVFVVIVGFMTAVYVAVVAGVGALIGTRGGSGVVLPIVATAIVGLAFQPMWRRARRFADRVVYGRRATPYEALTAVASPGSAADLSLRVARLAVESTAARAAVTWLRAGSQIRPAAWWPDSNEAPSPASMPTGNGALLPYERFVHPIAIGDEILGALTVGLGPGEVLPATDERLLDDLASQAAISLDRALQALDLPEGEVTLLMTDIEGSTVLWEENPSAMAHALGQHDALIQEAVTGRGGLFVKSRGEGDSTFSVFTDAAEAVGAALDLQRTLLRRRWPTPRAIRVRAALHTGWVEVRDRDYYGPVPNRCARLRSIAHGAQTLASKATRDAAADRLPPGAALRDLGAHQLKGLADVERVYQLSHPDLPAEFPPVGPLRGVAGS
jgi:class 3 adenylate cyclase